MDKALPNTPNLQYIEPVETIDLLVSQPSKEPFLTRVSNLKLSGDLTNKVHKACSPERRKENLKLSPTEEKELATEVLLLRHKFTELVWKTERFNQAALTVIQNIYLFRNRKIFFDPSGALYEQERQEALYLFTGYKQSKSLPLAKTFQHLIIARVWSRIRNQSCAQDYEMYEMKQLLQIVESLNTVRNIYVLLTTGLVKQIVSRMGELYKEGLSQDDAYQIGTFGVSRAAYRYHHSCGVRFSTYAGNWIKKEIQRQALDSRLIRISTNTIEQYSLAKKNDDANKLEHYEAILTNSSCKYDNDILDGVDRGLNQQELISEQELLFETSENKQRVHEIIESSLSEREADIIKRRFGLAPYSAEPQTVISIASTFSVTRSSIYQLEAKALRVLRRALLKYNSCYD